jgi:hypothetical protein
MQFSKSIFHIVSGISAMVLSMLACSPVIAISWNEFLVIALVFAVLLGPPLYRFIQRVDEFLKHKKKD